MGKKKVKLTKAASKDEFAKGENVFFYDEAPDLNRFATKGSEFEKTVITKNPQLLVKLGATDITANTTTLRIEGFRFDSRRPLSDHFLELWLLLLPGLLPTIRKPIP